MQQTQTTSYRPGERPLIWISAIGGVLSLLLAFVAVPAGGLRTMLIIIGVAALLVAIGVFIAARRRAAAAPSQEPSREPASLAEPEELTEAEKLLRGQQTSQVRAKLEETKAGSAWAPEYEHLDPEAIARDLAAQDAFQMVDGRPVLSDLAFQSWLAAQPFRDER